MANETKFYNGIDFQTNKGVNAVDPTNPQDVATKNYVDTHSGGTQRTFAFFIG